jgi:hypothetical protein
VALSPLLAVMKRLEAEYGPFTPGDAWAVEQRVQRALEKGSDADEAGRDELDLVRGARMRDLRPDHAQPQRDRRQVVGGTSTERWYAERVSEHIARLAAADPQFLELRERLWGSSRALSRHESLAILDSPILRIMTRDEIDRHGIPVLGHTVTLEAPRGPVDGWPETKIHVEWASGEYSESRRVREVHLAYADPSRRGQAPDDLGSPPIPILGWDEQGQLWAVPVEAGSVLDDVRRWAVRITCLGSPYASWDLTWTGCEAVAVRFLLTGTVPNIPALTAGWDTSKLGVAQVTLKALVGCEPESVAAAFAEARRRSLGGHSVPPRRLAMMLFVAEHLEAQGGYRRGFWPRLFALWRRKAPRKWRHAGWRNFRRDYTVAMRQATGPRHDRHL